MKFFFSDTDTSGLERKLKKFSYVSLTQEKRDQLKMDILMHAQANPLETDSMFSRLIERLKSIAAALHPREYFRTLLKEKLITLIDFNDSYRRRQLWNFHLPKKVFASITVFLFVIALFFNFTVTPDRVEASFLTVIDEVSGQVTIIRDSREIVATAGFLLKADDIIRTGISSKAVIRFLDQSVSRLDENTEIKISKLFINPRDKTETIVELVLDHGQVWARVINLIDNFSHFQVKAANTVATAKKKAAFNVSISSKKRAQVAAIQNQVELVVATDKKVVETTLVKGFSAEVKSTNGTAPIILSRPNDAADETWVKENLAQDKAYIETIKQEATDSLRDQANVSPNKTLSSVFTFNDFERHKQLLISAREKFAAAATSVAKGDNASAQPLIEEFQILVTRILEWIKQHEASDPAQALELKTQMTEMLNGYQKQFSVILPNDLLYYVKDVVGKTQLIFASDPLQKTQQQLTQASEKLLEAHDLVEQGDTEGATEQVAAYEKAVSGVSAEVTQLAPDAKEKAVSALIDSKVQDLKTLQALTTSGPVGGSAVAASGVATSVVPEELATEQQTVSVDPAAAPGGAAATPASSDVKTEAAAALPTAKEELQKAVSEVKTETLANIGQAVLDVQQTHTSVEVLQKLNDINKIDVNGKPFVDVRISSSSVTIKSDGAVVTTKQLPTANSRTPVSPPAQK